MAVPTSSDSGWGTIGGQSCFWDSRQDDSGKTDIFPDGMPGGNHNDGDDHEHIVTDSDDNIVYWRDSDGDVIIDSDADDPIKY